MTTIKNVIKEIDELRTSISINSQYLHEIQTVKPLIKDLLSSSDISTLVEEEISWKITELEDLFAKFLVEDNDKINELLDKKLE